jgi:hypothetical protein
LDPSAADRPANRRCTSALAVAGGLMSYGTNLTIPPDILAIADEVIE